MNQHDSWKALREKVFSEARCRTVLPPLRATLLHVQAEFYMKRPHFSPLLLRFRSTEKNPECDSGCFFLLFRVVVLECLHWSDLNFLRNFCFLFSDRKHKTRNQPDEKRHTNQGAPKKTEGGVMPNTFATHKSTYLYLATTRPYRILPLNGRKCARGRFW